MYILQQNLFSFKDWLQIESGDRLRLFFAVLDLRSTVKELKKTSPQGALLYSREAIIRAFLVSPLEDICTFTQLHRRLKTDLRFRYQCGFRLADPVPSISTLSRTFKKIVEKGLAEKLVHQLVKQCQEEGIIDGSHIAVDSCAVHAYEKKRPKSQWDGINATWGAKFDSFGNKITWFGYKIHLVVDTYSELPMAVLVTPANENDGDLGPNLIEKVASTSSTSLRYVIMDAGYDQRKNYEAAQQQKAQAIIPLNLRNEKEPPAGLTSHGTPKCSMGFEMTYWGAEGNYLKFRCPHATGQVQCPQGMAWCSNSNYGMVKKINIGEDLRRFSKPHRDTRAWKELYNQRTSVERCNSRLKGHLTANRIHVSGISKVKTHVYFNVIALLATAMAVAKAQKKEQIA